MRNFILLLVRDFGWIHLTLGLLGNILFFVGSVLFLGPKQDLAIWLFIIGSFFMLIGSAGQVILSLCGKK
jgi:hypothetical protein